MKNTMGYLKVLDHIVGFEFFQNSNEMQGEDLTGSFNKWIELGIFEVTKEYRDSIIKNYIESNDTNTESIFEMFSGKMDEEKRDLHVKLITKSQKDEKEINEIIEKELAELGIDMIKIKEILKKHNCSIVIQPD